MKEGASFTYLLAVRHRLTPYLESHDSGCIDVAIVPGVVSCRISLRPGGARSSPTAQEGTGRYRAPRDSPSERSVRSLNTSFPGPKPSQHLPIVGTISRGGFWNDTLGYGERGRRVADVLLFLELWRCSSSPRTRDIGRLTVGVGRYLDVL